MELIVEFLLEDHDGERKLTVETTPHLGDAMNGAIAQDVKHAPRAHAQLLTARLGVRYRMLMKRDEVKTLIPGEQRNTAADEAVFTFLLDATRPRLVRLHEAVAKIWQCVEVASQRSLESLIVRNELTTLANRTMLVRYRLPGTMVARNHDPSQIVVDILRPHLPEEDPFHPDANVIVPAIARAMLREIEKTQIKRAAKAAEKRAFNFRAAKEFFGIP